MPSQQIESYHQVDDGELLYKAFHTTQLEQHLFLKLLIFLAWLKLPPLKKKKFFFYCSVTYYKLYKHFILTLKLCYLVQISKSNI